MAWPTHLTISTGDRFRPGSPLGDDTTSDAACDAGTDIRQSLRISVTYALNEDDTDLTVVVTEKAAEVKAAYEAVWQGLGVCVSRGDPPASPGPVVLDQPVTEAAKPDKGRRDSIHFLPAAPFSSVPDWSVPGRHSPPVPMAHPSPSPGINNGSLPAAPPIALEPASAPQKILIRSKSRTVGLTTAALQEVLWKRYRLRSVERLSKSQANAVLLALEGYERTGRIEIVDPVPIDSRPDPGSPIGIVGMERYAEDPDDERMADDDWDPRDRDAPPYA